MESTAVTVTVPGNDLMSDLVGESDVLLRRIEGAFPGSEIHVRGNRITIDGLHATTVRRVFDELVLLMERGLPIDVCRALAARGTRRWRRARMRRVDIDRLAKLSIAHRDICFLKNHK